MPEPADKPPVIVALAGSNGAGKSTFYQAYLSSSGLRFLNADDLARELKIDAYKAAKIIGTYRDTLVQNRESFIFETVLSDKVRDKITFLQNAAIAGYDVTMLFVGLEDVETSLERVGMRVLQGGHDVPEEKIRDRFDRTLSNLAIAVRVLPRVRVYDNSNLREPYRKLAEFEKGTSIYLAEKLPKWFSRVWPP